MGAEMTVEEGEGDEAYVRHHNCPWFHWHKRHGLLDEDQSGCDTWFRTAVAEVNKVFASDIKVETQCSLPAGGDCCRRRIWVEPSRSVSGVSLSRKPVRPTRRRGSP
jgi:hypothetical protein